MADDSRYILNELYIKDYIVWTQTLSKNKLHSFGEWLESEQNTIHKSDVGFNLEQMEEVFSLQMNSTQNALTVHQDGGGSDRDDTDSCSSSSDTSLDSDDEEEA